MMPEDYAFIDQIFNNHLNKLHSKLKGDEGS